MMIKETDPHMPSPACPGRSRSFTLATAAAALTMVCGVAALVACGGGGSNGTPTPVPTPTPVATPLATPTPVGALNCSPTPPPLYGIRVGVIFDSGNLRRTLDSRPVVDNVDGYCGRAGFGATDKFCFTRQEGDPQATACDYMAVGRAGDTARYGPTWFYNGRPCTAQPGENGCSNHPDNQFLVLTRGDGEYAACAAGDIPVSTNPDRPGNRCGICTIKGKPECQ